MKTRTSLFLLACSLPLFGLSQYYNTDIEATIHTEQDNNMLQITGSAQNKTEVNESLRYVLSVIKSNPDDSNRSKNDQQGRFILEPNAKKNLSTTTININEEDRTILLLLIYDEDDKIVGKDRIVMNGLEQENKDAGSTKETEHTAVETDVKESNEDGFHLRGMVIENTKTKAGADFYDMFYSTYLSKNINGEKIVKVQEDLAIANNTQIKVFAGDDVVVQFIVNPRSQYLSAMADHSINRVVSYFQNVRNTKNQITRY